MNDPLQAIDSTWSTPSPPRARRVWLAALAVFVFASSLYLASLKNGFVWDDLALVENPDIRTLTGDTVKRVFTSNYWAATDATSGLYRPLTALTFHADYQLHGSEAAGYHLTNVLINAAASTLVLFVLLELFGSLEIAVVAALFFAAFPMHTENVAWVSGRTDLLATLFMLASLWCYAAWRSRGHKLPLAGAFACFGAALLAKETAIVLPAIMAITEFLPLHRVRDRRERATSVATVAGMFVVAALYLLLRRHVLGASVAYFHRFTHGAVQAVALSFSILAHYVYKLVFPFRLNAESDFTPPTSFWNLHTLVGVAIFLAACYALWRWRRRAAFVFGVAVTGLGLAPVLNILPLNQVLAERFLYFPSVGFSLLVGLGVVALGRRWRMPVLVVFTLVLAACSVRTVVRVSDWRDELTLFQKTVASSPDNARARASLGGTLYDHERYDEALNEFRFAVRANPSYAPGWSGLARTEGKLGRVEQALDDMQNAIDLDPDNALYYNSLGMLQFQAKDYLSAIGSFRQVLQIRPRHAHARFNLALAFYQIGDFDNAVTELTALENKDADFPNAWFFLAECESRRGNTDAAVQAATHFLTLHTTDDAMASRAHTIAGGNP